MVSSLKLLSALLLLSSHVLCYGFSKRHYSFRDERQPHFWDQSQDENNADHIFNLLADIDKQENNSPYKSTSTDWEPRQPLQEVFNFNPSPFNQHHPEVSSYQVINSYPNQRHKVVTERHREDQVYLPYNPYRLKQQQNRQLEHYKQIQRQQELLQPVYKHSEKSPKFENNETPTSTLRTHTEQKEEVKQNQVHDSEEENDKLLNKYAPATLKTYIKMAQSVSKNSILGSGMLDDVFATVGKVTKMYDKELKKKISQSSKNSVKLDKGNQGLFKTTSKVIKTLLKPKNAMKIYNATSKASSEDEILEELVTVIVGAEQRSGYGNSLTFDPVTIIALLTLGKLKEYYVRIMYILRSTYSMFIF